MSPTPVERFAPASGEPGAVLLETQRPGPKDRYSYLFRSPLKILSSRRPEDVSPLLEEASAWQGKGYPLAGFLSYEAGYALDGSFQRQKEMEEDASRADFPLLWFGVYGGSLRFDHIRKRWSEIGPSPPDWPAREEGMAIRPLEGRLTPIFSPERGEHGRKMEEIRHAIRNGEVYQVNLTGKFRFPVAGDPFTLFLRLREAQPVRCGAFLRTDDGIVVSCSPELFFRLRNGTIEVCPMKGTASRGLTCAEDRRAAASLRSDPKNRAENVMIVDLLRNDLGRVCRAGSIRVPRLFSVERYPSVLQMVSKVTGTVRSDATLLSIMRALFPCGSVTGAPKISAMRILRNVEAGPRGVYTGAIGMLLPGSGMTFSVAIRTVTVTKGRGEAGSGGGIVWDSDPQGEFDEALMKGRYLDGPPPEFLLIETLRWALETGFLFLEEHLGRLSASAAYFGFRFRRESALAALKSSVAGCGDAGGRKVRLLLGKGGDVSVEASPVPRRPAGPARPRVRISGTVVSSRDPFVRHKTTNRAWRDEELRAAVRDGYDEVLFLNERGELTEGAISNLFLDIGGTWFTPPASCGLLNGVRRGWILRALKRRAGERILRPEDLETCAGILLVNSVRGVRRAEVDIRHGP